MRNEFPQPRSLVADNARQPIDLSHETWSERMYGRPSGENGPAPVAPSWRQRRPPGIAARRP